MWRILFRSLKAHGFDAGALHGDMDQRARMAMLANFRDGKLRLLVASDVAARGLDIPDVSHVFNFDVPIHAEDYVHRIGRTGRAGRSGKSFTIATRADGKYVDAIEKLIGQKIEWHDGDLSTLVVTESDDDRPRRSRERGGRGERKPRDGRRGDDRRREPRDAVAATEAPPAAASVVPAEELAERRQRKEAIRAENGRKADRPSHAERPSHERPRRYKDDEVNTTVGFGSDTPAFMMVSAKV
jgi:superfamily II DNA/RNA helicase